MTKHAVRICASLAFALLCVRSASAATPTPVPRPFGEGLAYYHPTAIAPYRFRNTIVRISFDFGRGIVYGRETAVVVAKNDGLQRIPFNTLGIHYRSISVDGQPAAYQIDPRTQFLYVALHAPARAGQSIRVDFAYWAHPVRGIYFIRPDKGYPHLTPEIWSQGEMIDNRRWFPTWDEPNQKTPSRLVITVPRGWTAVANGYLASRSDTGKMSVWDWIAPKPKSTYLIAFAAGPLSEFRSTLGRLPVDSYVQPPYASLNALCFGRTRDIVAYDEHLVGVPFPWEKEDQVTAERFTYGGMENASVTIQTDLALHPPAEDLERPCDGLVAHELAHQWFGDDVTMADWSNVWINEGFATYFQELWSEHRFGEAEFEYERYNAQQAYFKETTRYWRPIVDYVYHDPLDNFDASGYPRPAQVLHMLRVMFGDARFFAALHAYLEAYQHRNADTQQFFSAIGASLGTNLGWFEKEWFYRPAYPHYYVTQRYEPASHVLTLDVVQRNHDGKPFRMPVVIQAYFGSRVTSVEPTIDRNRQTIRITGVTQLPQMVLFDPDDNILSQVNYPKTVAALAYQLLRARHVGDRLWALDQLTRVTGGRRSAAESAIRDAAYFDPFYGVRVEAVGDAAKRGDWETLQGALRDKDTRVVIAALDAAGELPKGSHLSLGSSVQHFVDDANPLVASAALTSVGALKPPGAYATLVRSLKRPSWREQIAAGAVQGLAAYGDLRALPLLEARTAYGTPELERDAAVAGLAQLAAKRPALVESRLLLLAQNDPLVMTRAAAATALGKLGDPSAIPALRRIQVNDAQQRVQGAAWNAILDIEDAVNKRGHA